MGPRRVPWRDWHEWEGVRLGLTGSDPSALRASLARVAVWRRRGRVPHAADATAALLEARLHDAGVPGAPGPHLSREMLRLAYAAALIRTVNGAVDPSQKGKFAAPVSSLARKIGLPTVLVDIRMEASHQELPTLELLRHGSERALQWLFERYWAAQRAALDAARDAAVNAASALVDAEARRREKAENVSRRSVQNRGVASLKKRRAPSEKAPEPSRATKRRRAKGEERRRSRSRGRRGGGDESPSSSPRGGGDASSSASSSDADAESDAPEDDAKSAKRDALNAMHAAVAREDTLACVDALVSVGVRIAEGEESRPAGDRDSKPDDSREGPESDPPDASIRPTMDDWGATATRLKKRWPFLHEELLLEATNRALDASVAVPPRRRAALCEVAARAAAVLGESGENDPAAENNPARVILLAAAAAAEEGAEEGASKPPKPGGKSAAEGEPSAALPSLASRRRALIWHCLRLALLAARRGAGAAKVAAALASVAPGAGRKFRDAVLRRLRAFEAEAERREKGKGKDEKGGGGGGGEEEGGDDDAFDAALDAEDAALLEAARELRGGGGGGGGGGGSKSASKKRSSKRSTRTNDVGGLSEDGAVKGGEVRVLRDDEGVVRAGKFTLARDWTPCAVGDLPAHLRGDAGGGGGDGGGEILEDPLLATAADPGVGVPGAATASEEDLRRGAAVAAKADLPWGAPGVPPLFDFAALPGGDALVGFGVAVAGVNYAVGAPFVDATRRVLPEYGGGFFESAERIDVGGGDVEFGGGGGAGSERAAREAAVVLPDPGVVLRGPSRTFARDAATRDPRSAPSSAAPSAAFERAAAAGRGVAADAETGAVVLLVDPDDDRTTEELDDEDEGGIDDYEERRREMDEVDDMEEWRRQEEEEEEEEEEEGEEDREAEAEAESGAAGRGADAAADADARGDALSVRAGGVEVRLTAADRDAVASDAAKFLM